MKTNTSAFNAFFFRKILFLIVLIISTGLFINANQESQQLGKVSQLQGMYIFTDSKPVNDFKKMGTVKNGFRFSGSSQYTAIRDRLIKKIKIQFPEANGIIIYLNDGSTDFAEAIKINP